MILWGSDLTGHTRGIVEALLQEPFERARQNQSSQGQSKSVSRSTQRGLDEPEVFVADRRPGRLNPVREDRLLLCLLLRDLRLGASGLLGRLLSRTCCLPWRVSHHNSHYTEALLGGSWDLATTHSQTLTTLILSLTSLM